VKEGYLGAYLDEGLSTPLLLQVVEELRLLLPTVRAADTHAPFSNLPAYRWVFMMNGNDRFAKTGSGRA
jgi:hypothetical protein